MIALLVLAAGLLPFFAQDAPKPTPHVQREQQLIIRVRYIPSFVGVVEERDSFVVNVPVESGEPAEHDSLNPKSKGAVK